MNEITFPLSAIRCRPWTRWQSHKVVRADKITKIEESDGLMKITMGDEPDAPVLCTSTLSAVEGEIPWPVKHKPQVGGYLVIYEDGYLSYSPAEAFEKGYRPIHGLTFGDAIAALKAGKRVCRSGWNGKGMWLALQPGSVITPEQARGGAAKGRADEGAESITICPHIDMRAADGTVVVGWLASQTDMLSEDWQILE